MNYFKKIIAYAKPYTKFAWLNILFNILYAIFNVLTIVAFIPVLNILFKQQNKIEAAPVYKGIFSLGKYAQDSFYYFISQKIETEGVINTLVFVCLLTLFLFFFKNFFRYLASFSLSFLRNGVVKDLRDSIYQKIIELPIAYFSEKKKGDIIARMTSDVQEIENSFLTSLESVVREPLTILISLIIMLVISTKLTLFVFILLPISGFIISSISKKLKAQSLKAQQETGNFLSFIEETLTGLRVIKGFNAEDKIKDKFKNSTNNFRLLMNSVLQRKTLASPMSEFLGSATIISILWYGGKLVLGDHSTLRPEQFLTYIGLFYLILNPVKALTTSFYNIQKGNASAERILDILETENTIVDKPNAINKKSFDKSILFENISFKYKDEYVLNNFSLELKKGQTVALVGQSGSGKSTLANLITRFYDVNKGTIKIDGIDIKDISQKSLRGLMGIVTQDSILFNDTVKNNISLGVESATDAQVIEAAKIANAHEFIKDLPEQYETNIGDSGNTLSGGQKQRLSIARAVLKNPPIMVLDEATSALDTESEQLVQKALEKMMENRTSLVIAHRLSTIQKANLIVVMKKGAIVEQGKHSELLAKKGEYFKLVTMQSL
ncbi:antibiotic ABC transporter ATP-binding protein [Lutibacter profundi]|uniref:Antibiotic ABC transporter ATP-binding protein n=1 Tax=Lutibacter profundi TaxID=1622118 RepID=A0A0X8G5H3_9FLAO|nr:ABC transporter ATP-binding protein [Lutibacter profundi]AMC10456.1 antibiotic ABC transporter ATP-binding protein [Lutibacter profundi]